MDTRVAYRLKWKERERERCDDKKDGAKLDRPEPEGTELDDAKL